MSVLGEGRTACRLILAGIGPTAWSLALCLLLRLGPPALGGAVLYNGIQEPNGWPPNVPEGNLVQAPATPAYLDTPPAAIRIDVGRQLFVDDFLIQSTTLARTFHKAEYYPFNPLLSEPNVPAGGAPYGDGVWFDSKERVFKMWYLSDGGTATRYATSSDGLRWRKPNLDVVPGTNIVYREPNVTVAGHSANTRDSGTIWMNPDPSDPARRFVWGVYDSYAAAGNHSNQQFMAIRYSPDGIHWAESNVRTGNGGDRSTMFYNLFRGKWVWSVRRSMALDYRGDWAASPACPYVWPQTVRHKDQWYRCTAAGNAEPGAGSGWTLLSDSSGGGYVRTRAYYEGNTLEQAGQWRGVYDHAWASADTLDRYRNSGPQGGFMPQLYNLDAAPYESLLLGLFSIYHGDGDGGPNSHRHMMDLCLGFSRDGYNWSRPADRSPFLGVSEANRTDWNWSNVTSVRGGCLVVGDRLYFYLSGRTDDPTRRESVGLATLRRDGFASMDAGDAEGTLTTRRLAWDGNHLFLNVDAGGGELAAEVLDDDGNVIPPFSRARCTPIRVDRSLQPVRWGAAGDLSSLAGRNVRFRFFLRKARLYSFWVTPDANGASRGYPAAGEAQVRPLPGRPRSP